MPEKVEIVVRLRDLASKGIVAVNKSLGLLSKTSALASTAMRALQGVIALAGLGAVGLATVARSFISAASAAEMYRVRLDILLGSQKEGNQLFQDMTEYASGVSFKFQDIMASATELAQVMRGGATEVAEWIPLVGDLAAATGKGLKETTSEVMKLYTEGAKGADNFRSRGLRAMLGFQEGVQYSIEQTREQMLKAFSDPESKFRGAALKLAHTWGGMLQMMTNTWFRFRTLVMDAGVFDYIKAALDIFLNYINRLKKEGKLDEWAKNIAKVVIASFKGIAISVAVLTDSFNGLRLIWNALTIAFGTFASVLNTGFSKVHEVIGSGLDILEKRIKKIGESLKDMPSPSAKIVGEYLSTVDLSVEAHKRLSDEIEENAKWWDEVVEEAKEELINISKQETALSTVLRVLEKIGKQAKKNNEEFSKGGRPKTPPPSVSPRAVAESNVVKAKADERLLSAILKDELKEREISVKEYYEEKIKLINDSYNKEKALLAQQKAEVGQLEPDKLQKIKDKEYQLEKAHELALVTLKSEQKQTEIEFADEVFEHKQYLKSLELRASAAEIGSGIKARHQEELAELDKQNAKELRRIEKSTKDIAVKKELLEKTAETQRLERLRILHDQELDLEASKLEEKRALTDLAIREMQAQSTNLGFASQFSQELLQMDQRHSEEIQRVRDMKLEETKEKERIDEIYRVQKLEKDKLLHDQERQLLFATLGVYSNVLGDTAGAFADLYENTGKKVKAFFYIAKAAAVADTVITTYKSAVDAYDAALKIGGQAGLIAAPIAASAAIIAGLARVAAIQSTSLARGGPVPGSSPTYTSDNVPIMATAGEYMHPVKAVKYYGQGVMEAIRTMSIPREVLLGYRSPVLMSPVKRFAAAGGSISPQSVANTGVDAESSGGNNYNITIQAIDAASFKDLGKRNPQVFVEVIDDALTNNSSLRKTIGSVLKGTI